MDEVLVIATNMPTWLVYVTIVGGFISCFLGYKLLKIWIAIIGFVIGMALGYFLSYKHVSNMAIPILIGFLVGLLIGFVAFRIYKMGVFLIAFVTTVTFFGQLLAHYNEPAWIWLILTLVLASVAAVVALKFVKPVIIISTALNGAASVVIGVFWLMKIDAEYMLLLSAILLAIVGVIVQFLTNKNTKHEK